MIGRTNISSGGISSNSAVLVVKAPTGSTVTIGGVITTNGHPFDANTNLYFFNVPYFGIWTVTATNGVKTDTQTVVINAANAYLVEMSYDFFLVRNGVLQNSVTLGSLSNQTAPTITDEAGYKKLVLPTNSGAVFSEVDFTQFSTIYIDSAVERKEYFSYMLMGFSQYTYWESDTSVSMSPYEKFMTGFPRGVNTISLTGIPSANKRFKICTRSTSSSGFDLYIYNVYLK